MKRFALLLALVLILSACAELPPPADTAPPRPTQTAAPSLSIEDCYALLESPEEGFNWLRSAMGCVFEEPSQIDLEFLFHSGFRDGSWEQLSAESEAWLIEERGFLREMDLQPMAAERIEEILHNTFGISLSACAMPWGWEYVEKEDLYCSNHNDAYFPPPFTITAVEDNGQTIHIHYHVDDTFYNTATHRFVTDVDMIYTLERQEDGTYHAVSNVCVP